MDAGTMPGAVLYMDGMRCLATAALKYLAPHPLSQDDTKHLATLAKAQDGQL
jgi:hypothetical protein